MLTVCYLFTGINPAFPNKVKLLESRAITYTATSQQLRQANQEKPSKSGVSDIINFVSINSINIVHLHSVY